MKLKFNMGKITRPIYKAGRVVKKHSPAILLVAGIGGVIGACVLACKETPEANKVVEDATTQLCATDDKKEQLKIKAKAAVNITKTYAPAIAVGTLSLLSISMSHRILTTRNLKLAAAYVATNKSFKEYRERVADKFGQAVENEIRTGVVTEQVEEKIETENGKSKTVVKDIRKRNGEPLGEYDAYFEEFVVIKDKHKNDIKVKNDAWKNDPGYNLNFLRIQQAVLTEELLRTGHMTLNHARKAIGLPVIPAGYVVGWWYDESDPDCHNCVNFGLEDSEDAYLDFRDGKDAFIPIRFNIDGPILEHI